MGFGSGPPDILSYVSGPVRAGCRTEIEQGLHPGTRSDPGPDLAHEESIKTCQKDMVETNMCRENVGACLGKLLPNFSKIDPLFIV